MKQSLWVDFSAAIQWHGSSSLVQKMLDRRRALPALTEANL